MNAFSNPPLNSIKRWAGLISLALCFVATFTPTPAAAAPNGLSVGTIVSAADDALPVALWDNSSYDDILTLINDAPHDGNIPALNNTLRHLLISTYDTRAVRNIPATPTADRDMLAVRLNKLIQMGWFSDAAHLYKISAGLPKAPESLYNGVLALLLDEQPALACLEALAEQKQLKQHKNGPDLIAFCYHRGDFAQKDQETENDPALSPLVKRILEGKAYNFRPSSFTHINKKTPLELALLKTEGKFNSDKLALTTFKKDQDELTPFISGFLRRDSALDPQKKFALLLHDIDRGLATPAELATFYDGLPEGEIRLADLFRALPEKQKTGETLPVLKDSLILGKEYGIVALTPFAPFWAEITPKQLARDSLITRALDSATHAGEMLPYTWAKAWKILEDSSNTDDILLYIAAQSAVLAPAKTDEEPFDSKGFYDNTSPYVQNIVKIIYETLDTLKELHNINGNKLFDAVPDLTFAEGYVIKPEALMKDLKQAARNNRAGEVFLLSMQALHGIPPEQMNGDILGEVLRDLGSVGLKKEAQLMAKDVILELDK